MMLVAIGESCKQLDRITGGILFEKHADMDWKGVKGIRDVISHHYFDIDAEVIYSVCKNHIPRLRTVCKAMLRETE